MSSKAETRQKVDADHSVDVHATYNEGQSWDCSKRCFMQAPTRRGRGLLQGGSVGVGSQLAGASEIPSAPPAIDSKQQRGLPSERLFILFLFFFFCFVLVSFLRC